MHEIGAYSDNSLETACERRVLCHWGAFITYPSGDLSPTDCCSLGRDHSWERRRHAGAHSKGFFENGGLIRIGQRCSLIKAVSLTRYGSFSSSLRGGGLFRSGHAVRSSSFSRRYTSGEDRIFKTACINVVPVVSAPPNSRACDSS
jgi:hypothetical protein